MHDQYLKLAFESANQIDPHHVYPNPRVGCVVVKDGEVLSIGVHAKRGEAHAEVHALSQLTDEQIKGSTVYVTLEPCDVFPGKSTGSCTQMLINKEVGEVVMGAIDVRFGGKNVEKFREAGIKASIHECNYHRDLSPFYDHYFYTKKPFVCAKVASTLDGMISLGTKNEHIGDRYEIITGNASRKRVHEMRSQYAAILTTTKTIVADNARLDVRLEKENVSNPDIVVLGKPEDIPKDADFWNVPAVCHMVSEELKTISRSHARPRMSTQNVSELSEPRVRNVYFFDTHDVDFVIQRCGELKINSLMTECGPTVTTALLQQELVDAVQLFQAPKIAGNTRSWVEQEIDFSKFVLEKVESFEGDIGSFWRKP